MLQLLTVGRISVDLYADAAGAAFTDRQRFEKSIGGTATNVAVAAARLGHRTAVWTKVGADPFGDYVVAKLAAFGVDTSFVGRDPVLRTPLAFAAMTPPEDPQLLFYRQPHAPDMQLAVGEVDDATLIDVPVLWVAGGDSGYVKREDGDRMRRHFPRTRLFTIKGTGHWVHTDAPEIIVTALRRFLHTPG
jgi:5-dehydro-2-deoxygluconokinase